MLIAHCPACGRELVNLKEGRHPDGTVKAHPLQCSNKDCPRPMAALEILSEGEIAHLVRIGRDGSWSMKHPLVERIAGKLLTCEVSRYIVEHLDRMLDGRDIEGDRVYRMWMDHARDDDPWGPLMWEVTDAE